MLDSWIVLVADPETGKWSVVVNSAFEKDADEFIKHLTDTDDPSPKIKIFTGDFVTV
jgi:hypothetical protein